MDFPQIWPHLSTSSRSWLMEHNGEPRPDDLIAEILSVTGGEQSAQWWTGRSVPGGISRQRAFPPTIRLMAGEGTAGMVPTFTLEPLDGVGAQLCPCNIATATPQAFTEASRLATSPSQGVSRTASPCGYALLTSPDLPDSSWRVS